MTPQTGLDGLLVELGKAHRDGAFSSQAAAYPWLADRRSRASRSVHRWSWIRVAIPLASAAAVAIVFVVPNFLGTRAVQDMARDGLSVVQTETPKTFADAEPATSQGRAPDCDYNGDGVIDGRDIQALVDQLRDADGDPLVKADHLQRCLLGS